MNSIEKQIKEQQARHDLAVEVSLQRLGIQKNLIANGKAMEAAEYSKEMAFSTGLSEFDLRILVCILSDAILTPVPRKRGDKFANRQTVEKLHAQILLAREVAAEVEKSKKQPRRKPKPVTTALESVGRNPKNASSVGTAKRAYYKHKP